jgi:toxin FitB
MLCVLDTNVVSELMREAPDERVLGWFDRHPALEFAATAISHGESLRGIARLPDGARKSKLLDALALMLSIDMGERLLSFDARAMQIFAEISLARDRAGRPMSFQDACIAATCLAHGAALATRDAGGFEGVGLVMHNPWQD